MNAILTLALLSVSLASAPIPAQAKGQPPGTHPDTLTLRNVTLVDVPGGSLVPGRDVVIVGDRIAWVGPTGTGPLPSSGDLLDGEGGFLIPALWDSHVHLFSAPGEEAIALPLDLINGVATVRDMGARIPLPEQREVVQEVSSGERPGPRMVLHGALIDGPPGAWPNQMVAGSPDEGRQRVRESAALGWEVVKVYSLLPRGTYLAIADEAKRLGLPVVGHVPESVTLRDAVAAGQIEVSHISRVTQACTTQEEAMVAAKAEALASDDPLGNLLTAMAGHVMTTLESWDEETCWETARMLAEAGVAITPTLMVSDFYVGADPSPDDPRMTTVPAAVREQWGGADFRRQQMTKEMLDAAPRAIAQDWRTVKIMHEAGVTILAGTDAAFLNPYLFHGATLHLELERFVALGLSPREALASATIIPARFFDGDAGALGIAPGGRADLVLLGANPLEDITNTRVVVATIASGRLYDRQALNGLKQQLEDQARKDYER